MYDNIKLICPICADALSFNEKSLICKNGHCFDIARQGYVNLLPVQNKHSLTPGDTKLMLQSRRNFLNEDFYEPVCSALCEIVKKYSSTNAILADIGCGEGYYTTQLKKRCGCACAGFDISKEAAKMACSRSREILWAVATAAHIPMKSESADIVTAVFSLFVNDEYARILKPGGIFIEATAGSDHLRELKELIYDEVFEQNKKPSDYGKQFVELEQYEKRFSFTTDHKQLCDLLMMTPHAHRIKAKNSGALDKVEKLCVTADIIIRVLKKIGG